MRSRREIELLRLEDLAAMVRGASPRHGEVRVVGVDGGSAAGKSTFAARLAAVLDADVVHTDDIAWHHSFFEWWPLLVEHVLDPLAAGRDVAYRPAAWEERERPGAITARATGVVVVEGVGACRRELDDRLDLRVWMDVPRAEARERGLERDGPEHEDFWWEWDAAEVEHLAADEPWRRANLIVDGAPAGIDRPDLAVVRRRARWDPAE